ncbi:hypothetical protein ASD16_10455 [Cellulomonas sp. Root485]|uniref:hypothetical protein n=1 Tax=Cellulomonas sp. Root485 TaxID=1736546 RepID=UPI0006F2B237|nr:hypothetical protein [Cellulomonas sp. Root485]KQY23006.1 hypothetical protein ASD16_10455 [Cellulomonas sp. Root485]
MSTPVHDAYEERYAAKLWSLLPAVYRAADSQTVDGDGPLRELLERVGASMAVVRRSIDRLWEDQSIETCDTWVIPYLADLLATNLVPSMDARGRRLDVANTIAYRRRKGTVALLEQLAHDVTGYETRAIEMFRRLARTRHGLDPAIGRPADDPDPTGARALQHAEQLTGLLTGTPAGGWADLRHPLGATLAHTAFDEYAHRLDVRVGRGDLGWYGIPKVGFFLWRTVSFGVDRATPVPVAGCPGHYAFDPTGRQVPLFTAAARGGNDYGETWLPIDVWQVPAPLTEPLWASVTATPPDPTQFPDPDASLWPRSLSVTPEGTADPLELADVTVWPEVGRFRTAPGTTTQLEVGYHYGLFSRIGAGPYDRRQVGVDEPDEALPRLHLDGGSAIDLPIAIGALGSTGTIVVDDGRTLTTTADVGSVAAPIEDVTLRAAQGERAVIRLAPGSAPWVFTGAPTTTPVLHLAGLLVSGTDVVLRGAFEEVRLTCCTLDPGTSGAAATPPTLWQSSVDGRDLAPVTLWVEGQVGSLVLDRCITGPVRVRAGGLVERLTVTDSVVQGLPTEEPGTLTWLRDPQAVLSALHHQRDELTTWLAGQLTGTAATAAAAYVDGAEVPPDDQAAVVADLQAVVDGPLVWTPTRFADRPLRDTTAAAALSPPATGPDLAALNRQLLAEAFPVALADAALATDAGLVELCRTTLLGPAYVHRLECSESLLDDVVRVRDAQDGCVRFSAWSTGSALPRRYESVRIAPGAPVMVSRRFGEWGYAQLPDGADSAILGADTAGDPSLLTGSHAGSEMGAFCRDAAAVKDRSLLIKLQEYLPVGLAPVLVHLPAADPEGELTRGRPWPPM